MSLSIHSKEGIRPTTRPRCQNKFGALTLHTNLLEGLAVNPATEQNRSRPSGSRTTRTGYSTTLAPWGGNRPPPEMAGTRACCVEPRGAAIRRMTSLGASRWICCRRTAFLNSDSHPTPRQSARTDLKTDPSAAGRGPISLYGVGTSNCPPHSVHPHWHPPQRQHLEETSKRPRCLLRCGAWSCDSHVPHDRRRGGQYGA